MALNKLKFNSLNVTPTAGKTIGFNSSADGLEATLSGGSMTFIKKLTASSSSTLSFVNGSSDVVLDNTYKEYIFIFNNIHPSADGSQFLFNLSADNGSNYNVTKTTTAFRSFHSEDDSATGLGYYTGGDLAQSTDFQRFADSLGNDNDQSLSGTFTLFNPSSTTFVKHFLTVVSNSHNSDYIKNTYTAGYYNTTSDIDAVQFTYSSGNIDAGTIKLYGIKDS